MMSPINLTDDPRGAIPVLMRRVHERAVADYDEGHRVNYRTGKELMSLAKVTHWRNGNVRLASTIYNQTMWSLSVADEEAE